MNAGLWILVNIFPIPPGPRLDKDSYIGFNVSISLKNKPLKMWARAVWSNEYNGIISLFNTGIGFLIGSPASELVAKLNIESKLFRLACNENDFVDELNYNRFRMLFDDRYGSLPMYLESMLNAGYFLRTVKPYK